MKDFKNLGVEDYFRILWRRFLYFIIPAVLVPAGAGYYAWKAPLVYKSETRILVEPRAISTELVASAETPAIEDQIEAIRHQLASRTFLQRLVEEFQLHGYGSGAAMANAVSQLQSGQDIVVESRSTFRVGYSAGDPTLARDIAKRLAEAVIQINTATRKSRALETDRFVDEQLRQVERNLNAHEEKLKDFKTKHFGELPDQAGANMSALTALNTQLSSTETALQRVQDQRRLLDYRIQEQRRFSLLSRNLLPTEMLDSKKAAEKPVGTTVKTESAEVTALKAVFTKKQAELAEMSAKWMPKHPEVTRLTQEVRQLELKISQAQASHAKESAQAAAAVPAESEKPPIPTGHSPAGSSAVDTANEFALAEIKVELEASNREVVKLEKEKEGILQQIRLHQGRLNLGPTLEQELLSLTREHEELKRQHSDLQARKFNAQMTANLETDRTSDTFKIIDEAYLPVRPIRPDRPRLVLMGLAGGMILGLGLVFAREYIDPTFGGEEEAANVLNLPVLVSIPEIPLHEKSRRKPVDRMAQSA